MNQYFSRVGTALSILFNVILGGPLGQSFSARNYGWQRENKRNLVWLIDITSKVAYIILLKPLTMPSKEYIIIETNQHCLNAWIFWRIERRKYLNKEIENGKTARKD